LSAPTDSAARKNKHSVLRQSSADTGPLRQNNEQINKERAFITESGREGPFLDFTLDVRIEYRYNCTQLYR